jgi:tRNA A-37 threonylcarbamoyl transferase component Bud32
VTREDEALARVLIGGKHLEEATLEKARLLQKEKHPKRDLADVLLQYKLLDKEKLAVAQRLAKMSRTQVRAPVSGGAAAEPRAAGTDAKPVAETKPSPNPTPSGAAARASDPAPPPTATDSLLAAKDTAPSVGRPSSENPTPLLTPRVDAPRVKLATDRTHFGRYDVVGKIAKGGMGVVFKVRHPGLDRLYALKVLAQGEDADEEVLERFRREAKTAARLDHPAIVRVHDAGTEDGFPYIVMDLIEGDSLARILKDEGVSPRKGAIIARSIAQALAHAHEQGIVHRDVKPDNILIDRATGEAKLSDFGIVKDLKGNDDARLTKTGLTLGSPCYMSPEQASGRHKDVGPLSDVYSLGAALYEMLAGAPPFDGESIHSIMTKVVHDDPVPPRRRNAAVSVELQAICMKTLEKEPRRRYPSAAALAEDLERYLDGRPVLARPPGIGRRIAKGAQRHRALGAAAALLVLAAAWIVGRELITQRRSARERAERLAAEVDLAERTLASARDPKLGELETRRAFRDAMRQFDRVLEEWPGDARARDGKGKAALALADRLLERREVGFAEFVLDQAEGFADAAMITSRRELARKSEWVVKAHDAELAGDLDEAARLLKEGIRALREAGLTGELLEQKLADLESGIAARKREDEVKSLAETAERQVAAGDPALALETFKRAAAIAPDNATLTARVQLLGEQMRRICEEALDRAGALAERAKATLPPGVMTRPELTTALEQGETFRNMAREHLGKNDYSSVPDLAKRAQDSFQLACDIASALAAREDARVAREAVEKNTSASFALTEIQRAKEKENSGESLMNSGDFVRARADFVEAATAYRLATGRGEIKQQVAAARDAARQARVRAQGELPQTIQLRAARDAEALEKEALANETSGDLGKARELWAKAAGEWSQAESLGRPARETLGARTRAQTRKSEADAEDGQEFDPADMEQGRNANDEGDSALAREDFEKASERYGKAEYYWKQAAAHAAPLSRPRKRTEALRKAAEEARVKAKAKAFTKKYEEADAYMAKAAEAEQRKYWRGADDYYGRAKTMYDSLAPSEEDQQR